MATIEVTNLTAGYHFPILHNLSFSADCGELIGIIGHNGCGKSTLFRTMIGATKLYSGNIIIEKKDISKLSVRKRAELLTCMPQQSENSLSNGLRGIDMIEMGYYAQKGLLYSLTRSEKNKIKQLAERFGMTPHLYRELSKMSGGERQMIALMRTIVQNTPVILLDEPSGSLDFSNTHLLFEMLLTLCRTENKTILTVLHDPSLALRYCSRILLMEKGTIFASIHPNQTNLEYIQTQFRRLYPTICIGYESVSEQYFCYSAK